MHTQYITSITHDPRLSASRKFFAYDIRCPPYDTGIWYNLFQHLQSLPLALALLIWYQF